MKRFFPFVPLLATLALVPAACDRTSVSTQPQLPAPEVVVVTAESRPVPLIRDAVGLLAPTRVAEVRARVAGIVLRRVYAEGTDVTPGQILFQIDPAPLQAALRAEEAALAKAEADAANAALIANRYRDLAARRLLASQDLDTAVANERSTRADVGEARANVEKARLDLDYATVTAPIAGYAGRALVTEGALVGQGEATQLTTIEQVDPIYVNFSQTVGEMQQLRQAGAVSPGADSVQRVDIVLPDGTPYPHPGTLDFSGLSVDSRTGVVALRAVVPNPGRRLLPGMFVKLRVTMGRLDNAFLLPQAAVQLDDTGAYVLLVDADGKVGQRRVRTGGMTQTDWIISGGLADGDRVIVEGLQNVSAGATAKAIPAAASDTSRVPAQSAPASSG